MSDTQNKYINGKIYKLSSASTDNVYIGSTYKSLQHRLSGHRITYNHYKFNDGSYISSFEIIKYDDCIIELVELYPCDNQDALRIREDYHLKLHPNAVNIHAAYQSPEDRKKYHNDYNNNYNKQYLENNKDKISEQRKQKVTCKTCGVVYTKGTNSRHMKSQIHLQSIKADYTTEADCDICHIRYKISDHEKHIQSYDHLSMMEVTCEVCGVKHQKCATSHHIKTKTHLDALNNNYDVTCDICNTEYKIHEYEKHIQMSKHLNHTNITCDICNITYKKSNTKDHLKSKYHLNNVANLKN
jgi:hypothetical protein